MAKITGVHHIAVRAVDFDRSVSFYTNTLGLRLEATWTTKAGRAAFVEISPGSFMEIFERPPASFSGQPVILHFALRTDDCDGMVERAKADGYSVTVSPLDVDIETSVGPAHLRLAFILGPDGEEIELMTSDVF